MSNLKEVSPEACRAAIEAAVASAIRDLTAANEAAAQRLAEEVAKQRAAAELVAEIANIDAASLVTRSVVAAVRDVEIGVGPGSAEPRIGVELRLRASCGQIANPPYGNSYEAQLEMSRSDTPVPAGRYRAVVLLVPIEPAPGPRSEG